MNDCEIIFGAPGCGKTTELMGITESILKKYDPNKVAFASFTRKGTYEGVQRAIDKFSLKEDDLPYFRTLHSIAFREGGYKKYDLIQKRHYREFSDSMGMNFVGYYTEDFFNNDDRYLFLTFLERNNPEAAKNFSYDIDTQKLESVRRNYLRYKAHAKVVDFTEIIETFILRGKALPVEIAIIDEAQDLTTLQWTMCEVAFRNCKKVYVAGDDDQAIYEWSGADVSYFLNIQGKRKVLNQSFRLQKKILALAKSISQRISHRVPKEFNAIGDTGNVFFHNRIEDIELKKDQSYYFLSRNNYFLFKYREALRKQAEIFWDKDKLSISLPEINAIQLFEKSRKQALSEIEQVRLQAFLKDNPNKATPWYHNLNFDNDKIAYYKDLIKFKTNLNDRRITINTIHGVKGGEADNVILILDITNAVKQNFDNNPDSELRCLYVACTRAKKNLHIVFSDSKSGYEDFIDIRGGNK